MAIRISSPLLQLSPSPLFASIPSSPLPSVLFLRRRLYFPALAAAPRRRSEKIDENDAVVDEFLELDEEEEDDVFGEMQKWLEKKPRGFGEGKTYDTALEDELWEEMERSRKGNELARMRRKDGGKKKEMEKTQKDVNVIPYVTRVRLWNLPRKKNIHRDLQLAFKGFPGIVNISPAVVGNEKTREPICKGFAFVDFKSEEAANRFVQVFSEKSLVFGKVQKQISCSVVNTQNSSGQGENMPNKSNKMLQYEDPKNRATHNVSSETLVINDSSRSHLSRSKEGSLPQLEEAHVETFTFDVKNISGNESGADPDGLPFSSKKQKNKQASKKKTVKKKPEASKFALCGSFSRLKVKERSVLTGIFSGVLSKYSAEAVAENR